MVKYEKETLKNNFFSLIYKMSKKSKIYQFYQDFHNSKQPIDLMSVNIDQIVVSDRFNHSDAGFKYFIGHQEGRFVKPL